MQFKSKKTEMLFENSFPKMKNDKFFFLYFIEHFIEALQEK